MPDLHIYRLEFENTFALFKISMPEFVLFKSLVQK